MADPHASSVRLALSTVAKLDALFASIGVGDPNGWLMRLYRTAQAALAGKLDYARAVSDAMAHMRETSQAHAEIMFYKATQVGATQAESELALYGVDPAMKPGSLSALADMATKAFMATLNQQITSVEALAHAGIADEEMILGSVSHAGLLTPGPVLREGARWITNSATSAWTQSVTQSVGPAKDEYMRQAIAAIDDRTTDCCLNVNGQLAPIDGNFNLDGDPWPAAQKYGFTARSSPFHWYAILAGESCLTSDGYKPIENVRVGDLVFTHRGRYMPVTMALSRKHSGTGLLIETSGGALRVTPEHPILTATGWRKSGTLREGDVILGCDELHSGMCGLTDYSGFASFVSNAHHNHPGCNGGDISSAICVPLIPPVGIPIDLKVKVQHREIEIENIFPKRFLELEVNPGLETNRFKPLKPFAFTGNRMSFVCGRYAGSPLLNNSRHTERVPGLHAGGCLGVGDPYSGMDIAFPMALKGIGQSASFDTGFRQTTLNNIAGNTHCRGDFPLRSSGGVSLDDSGRVNVKSFGHSSNLCVQQYTIKVITTLVLSDATICDLSVEGDESYCIAGHFVHNCRTAIALVHVSNANDSLTQQMVASAQAEISNPARAARYPVNAFSGGKSG